MYPYLYRWCGILVIPGFFTTICTTNPFCTEYSCTDRVWVDWKSGGGKQVHKARARRERNRDKLSHFSKKTVAKRGGKGGRTSGAACSDSVRAHFRRFTKMRKREPELAEYVGTNCPQIEMLTRTGKRRKTLGICVFQF